VRKSPERQRYKQKSNKLDLTKICRGVVSFMLWPFYPYGKRAMNQLNNRLDELQAGVEIATKRKITLLPGIEGSQPFHSQKIFHVNSATQDSLLMI
jgi:hypothetical protein